jgi:hypothetical protein
MTPNVVLKWDTERTDQRDLGIDARTSYPLTAYLSYATWPKFSRFHVLVKHPTSNVEMEAHGYV